MIRHYKAPRFNPARDLPERPGPSQVSQIQSNPSFSQLIAGCGAAIIDGYLDLKQYAASKGLDLVEFHHKGIDFQDLLSTLIIDARKQAEQEGREPGTRRWKR